MNIFLSIAVVLAGALVFEAVLRRLQLPGVTAYILLGIILGPQCLDLITEQIYEISGLISLVALGLIAFMLGENLSLEKLRRTGKSILWISISESIGVCILVTAIIYFGLRQPFCVAVLLGAIATATAPAATILVVREYKARGTFTNTLLGIVAIDDAWGIIIFTICLSAARLVCAPGTLVNLRPYEILHPLYEILGSLLLGGVAAIIISKVSQYTGDRAHLLVLVISGIFMVVGVSLSFGLSLLLANVALGTALINIDNRAGIFFDTLREVDQPIYIMFFVLAGAHFDFMVLKHLGGIGIVYTVGRMAGKVIAVVPGGYLADSDSKIKRYLGLALFPQAGVALGMALVVKNEFPDAADVVFTITVATTIIFEIIGPICTRYALLKAGEIPSGRAR